MLNIPTSMGGRKIITNIIIMVKYLMKFEVYFCNILPSVFAMESCIPSY